MKKHMFFFIFYFLNQKLYKILKKNYHFLFFRNLGFKSILACFNILFIIFFDYFIISEKIVESIVF